ncbi:MAG: S-layer homology domain-containing protein [Oscillospiraceae bacterium]|nr:S-layer homology domain-containing protein [Oscillospiraceae bacterium]
MKKILAAVLAAVMLLGALCVGAGASFSDITDPDLARRAAVLEQLDVIDGVGGGLFIPEGTFTRAEFCKMTVHILAKQGEAAQYAASSIFTDVRASDWFSGVVHYCARNGIVLGIGDGSFAPRKNIYFGEAVTVLMRTLGYKDTDFVLPWPQGYIAEAAKIGLSEGLPSLGRDSGLTRAQAVRLFNNMLLCETTGGALFAETVYGGLSDNAVIIAVGGNKLTAVSDGAIKELTAEFAPETNMVGTVCRLVTDAKGHVRAAIPTEAYTARSVTVSESKYTYILDTDGGRHVIGEETLVVVDGRPVDYSSAWLSIRPGAVMTAYYDSYGDCVLVTVGANAAAGKDIVVLENTPANLSTLAVMFGLDQSGSYVLYKNGTLSTVSDLKPYDVVTCDKASRTFFASDFRLTGYYESAWPNYETPTKINMLGTEFELYGPAREDMTAFSKGARVTLLFTADMRVGGVVSSAKATGEPVALCTQASADSASVTLFNGMELTAPVSGNYSSYVGRLVKVRSVDAGKLSLAKLDLVAPGKTLYLETRMLGDAQLSASCAVYDSVNGRCVRRIELSDITSVTPTSVAHAGYDTAGRVNVIVLGNVTGLCYEYGLINVDTVYDYTFGDEAAETEGVSLTNSKGTIGTYPCTFDTTNLNGAFGGIAFDGDYAVSSVALTSAVIARSDFVEGYAVAGGVYYPISSDVQCYIKDSGTWVGTVDEVRTASNSLRIYFDKAPEQGGMVRVIVAE